MSIVNVLLMLAFDNTQLSIQFHALADLQRHPVKAIASASTSVIGVVGAPMLRKHVHLPITDGSEDARIIRRSNEIGQGNSHLYVSAPGIVNLDSADLRVFAFTIIITIGMLPISKIDILANIRKTF